MDNNNNEDLVTFDVTFSPKPAPNKEDEETVPWWYKIPILGQFFRYKSNEQLMKENEISELPVYTETEN